MDIRMPDGTLIRNVPDGTTKEELLNKLEGYPGLSEAKQQNPTEPEQEVDHTPLQIAGEVASAANEAALFIPDTIIKAANLGINALKGEFSTQGIPTLTDTIERGSGDRFRPGESYMEPGMARDAARVGGSLLTVGGSLVPVRRTADTAGSVLQDILGLGFTEVDDAVKAVISKQRAMSGDLSQIEGSGKRLDNWYDKLATPVSDVLRFHVDDALGGTYEKAIETSTRNYAAMAEEMLSPNKDIVKLASEEPLFKAALMDLHKRPAEKLFEARMIVQDKLGVQAVERFDTLIGKAVSRNKDAQKLLFTKGSKKSIEKFDPVFLHTNKKQSKEERLIDPLKRGAKLKDSPSAFKERKRKPAWKMTQDELNQYENPLLSHMKYMADQEEFLSLTNKFGMPASLGKEGTSKEFFDTLSKTLQERGLKKELAEASANLMHRAHLGSKEMPPALVRSLMHLGYAGTLAQPKTALLNLHDFAVSAVNNGVMPTMKAAISSTKGEFGKNMEQLGITNTQGVGEYVRSYDSLITDPNWSQKMAGVSEGISSFSMASSGFRFLDRVGKGGVLRATVNKARQDARSGDFIKNFGDSLTPHQVKMVTPYLKSKMKVKDMPPRVQKVVEEMAFTGLGKQQLISVAGRPLNYLEHTWTRPLYAMTGFAIKQQAMLRRHVIHEIKKGNYAKAGSYAARYAMYAGLGYGIIDEGRSVAFKGEEFHPEDILVGAAEQVGAAITLNRLGDGYSLEKFRDNPAEYLIQSLLPPLGLTEAFFQDVSDLILKGEYNAELVKKAPALGDFYKYYWADKKEDKGSKAEQYSEMVEDWGE